MNRPDDLARAVEQDRALWQAGYRAGVQDSCRCVHPQISASVAELFGPWDGAQAARRRSVERFRAEQRSN